MLGDEEKRWIVSAGKLHVRNLLSNEEAICRLRDVAVATNLSEVMPLLPKNLARALRDNIGRFPTLKAVGYWWSSEKGRFSQSDRFPNPAMLTNAHRTATERNSLLAYLRLGRTYAQWRGLSYCRLKCGADYADMGSRCLTDGIWIWPEGLSHYVECHEIALPSEFIRTMKRRGWRLPSRKSWPKRELHGAPDFSFWIAWSEKQVGRHRTNRRSR